MMDWDAIGAISTAAAAGVALGLGLLGEARARGEAKRADARLEFQVERAEFRRRQEFIADRLLQLVNEVGTYVAHVNGPQAAESTTRMRALVQALPANYATTIKRWLGVHLDPRHVNIWRRYAPDDCADNWTTPDFSWVQAELADDLRDAMDMRP